MNSRVLVIDDEQIIRVSCERTLAPAGYSVTTTADGHEGLALLKERPFDVVLLDMKMPNMDGLEFLETLSRSTPARVIVITGYCTAETASAALKFGAWGYLEKPFNPGSLLSVVKEAAGN